MNMQARISKGRAAQNVALAGLDEPDSVTRIDRYVRAHKDGTPFHLPAWLKAVERGTGQEPVCLIYEHDGELKGILPGHIVHSPLFGRALVSSGFAVGGGVLADSEEVAAILHQEFWRLAERYSCPTAELRGGMLPTSGWIRKTDSHAGFVTDLAKDDEAQLLAIPRKQRAEVRKGLKNDLHVSVGSDGAAREAHYAVYSESVRNLGTPVFPKSLFDAVMDGFGEDADILTVSHDGRPIASVLSLYYQGIVMPYWGGGIWDARRLRANDVMYYALMNHARRRGCARFDFGRSKTGTGAYHFKCNWGFEPDPLSYALRTADGTEPRDINPLSPKYKAKIAVWQRLPLPVANRIGPWIAKGLG